MRNRPFAHCRTFWVIGGLALGAVLCQPQPALAQAVPTLLVQSFRFEPAEHWTQVSLSADPGAWHVGGAEGPPATAAQLKAALENAKLLMIGVRCQEARAESTRYPCGLELAGWPGALPAGLRWFATSGDTLTRYDDRGAPASVLASTLSGEGGPLAQALRTTFGLSSDFLGLFALTIPGAALGPSSSFRARVTSSPLRASQPDLASGAVTIGTVNPFATAASKHDAV